MNDAPFCGGSPRRARGSEAAPGLNALCQRRSTRRPSAWHWQSDRNVPQQATVAFVTVRGMTRTPVACRPWASSQLTASPEEKNSVVSQFD